jgi:Kdo2-lipid IVA lauroyltransferase/acyltransferase
MPDKKNKRKNRYKRGGLMAAVDALRYRAGEYSLRGFVALLPRLPPAAVSALTSGASGAAFRLLWRYRARMERNLALALAEEVPSQRKRSAIVRRTWRNFALSVLETMRWMQEPKERIAASIAMQGEEHLKDALAKGRGVLALSAHVGNFTMIGARVVAAGYPFSAIVKQPRDPRFAALMDEYRARVGVATISAKPRRDAARAILRALRANRVVLVVADEFKSGGVPVDFFGIPSLAPRGPATLALRTGAAVVPMFMIRDGADRLTLRVEPEIDLLRSGDLESDVAENTVKFTRCLEAIIRSYPDQWNWLGFKRPDSKPRKRQARDASGTND